MENQKNGKISKRGLLKLCACALLAAIAQPVFGGAQAAIAASGATSVLMSEPKSVGDKKMLIIHYSWGGNTRHMAEEIQALTGADIFELKTVTPYPKEYRPTTVQAKREQESGYRPPLSVRLENLADYDVIFIGSPNWWGTLAMPFFTFLEEYDLSGKTVIPFMTHEGSGFGRTLTDLKRLCPNSAILEGLAVRGGRVQSARSEIAGWLAKINMKK